MTKASLNLHFSHPPPNTPSLNLHDFFVTHLMVTVLSAAPFALSMSMLAPDVSRIALMFTPCLPITLVTEVPGIMIFLERRITSFQPSSLRPPFLGLGMGTPFCFAELNPGSLEHQINWHE